jgi:hypothetical protein
MISRKFLGVGMQQIMSRPSRLIRNPSHYCFTQSTFLFYLDKSNKVSGQNRYSFSGVPGSGNKGDQPMKPIKNMVQLS